MYCTHQSQQALTEHDEDLFPSQYKQQASYATEEPETGKCKKFRFTRVRISGISLHKDRLTIVKTYMEPVCGTQAVFKTCNNNKSECLIRVANRNSTSDYVVNPPGTLPQLPGELTYTQVLFPLPHTAAIEIPHLQFGMEALSVNKCSD